MLGYVALRDFKETDIPSIDRIFNNNGREYQVPSLRNVLANRTVIKKDKVVGYGVIKLFAEAVLFLDKYLRKRDKATALNQVLCLAFDECKSKKVEQLFIVSNSGDYTKVLKKRYGFKEVEGTVLFLELDYNGK